MMPSVEAKNFSSRMKLMRDEAKPAPGTCVAAALARRRRSTLSSIDTEKGSISMGLLHSPSSAGPIEANSTGRRCAARFARAWATAFRAVSSAASFVWILVAAKPHVPSTRTRTPTPDVSLSERPVTSCSRVLTFWLRFVLTRTSA